MEALFLVCFLTLPIHFMQVSYQWDVERTHFLVLCVADDNFFLEFYSTLRLYWFQSSCSCVLLYQTNIFTSAFRHPLLAENHTTLCCLPRSLPISLPSEEAKQAFSNALQVKPAWLAHIHVHHQENNHATLTQKFLNLVFPRYHHHRRNTNVQY